MSPGPTRGPWSHFGAPSPRRPPLSLPSPPHPPPQPRPPSWGLPIALLPLRAHPHLAPGAPTHAEAPVPPGGAGPAVINSPSPPAISQDFQNSWSGGFLVSLERPPGNGVGGGTGSGGEGPTPRGFGLPGSPPRPAGWAGREAVTPRLLPPGEGKTGHSRLEITPRLGC